MTSCAILFFFFFLSFLHSFFLLFLPLFSPLNGTSSPPPPSPWIWSFLIQTRDRLKGFAQEGYSISSFSSSSISLPPPLPPAPYVHPFCWKPTCPTVFASRVTKDAEIQKSRSSPDPKGDLSFFDFPSIFQWPCYSTRSLSLPLPPHSPPLSRPRKGPSSSSSSSIPSFLLLARFSPFFHHGLLSGVLNPFFPRQLPRNSCIRVGRPDSRRALARDSFV